MKPVSPAFLGGVLLVLAGPDALADPVREAASAAVECRSLAEPTARLACFDATSAALRQALEPPSEADAKTAAPVPEPSWAEAPAPPSPPPPQLAEPVPEAREFTATIVRITRNGVGRHKFYTQDGAVWEQTQIEEIRPPRSLPAVAEFRRRLTGNPTISFDISNRAYRVRRIE